MDLQKFYALFNKENIMTFIQTNSLKIVFIVCVFYIAKNLKKYFNKGLKHLFEKVKMEQSISTFLISMFSIVYYVILAFLIVDILGINITAITAFLGTISIVLGLAFKETLANFCGGIIILTFKPFKVGDLVEYKDYVGTVKAIELFYTRIVNPQNELIIIPNGIITNTEIRNISKQEIRRLDLLVGVSYNSNIEKVKNTLQRIVLQLQVEKFNVDEDGEGGEPLILNLEDKQPVIGIQELSPSAITFSILVYVNSNNYLKTKLLLNEKIVLAFREEGIEIPYPQMDVYVTNKN